MGYLANRLIQTVTEATQAPSALNRPSSAARLLNEPVRRIIVRKAAVQGIPFQHFAGALRDRAEQRDFRQ